MTFVLMFKSPSYEFVFFQWHFFTGNFAEAVDTVDTGDADVFAGLLKKWIACTLSCKSSLIYGVFREH